jgi:probable HAF family extracellular repeat protein
MSAKSMSLNSRPIILSLTSALIVSSPAGAADFTPGLHGFLYTGGSFTQIDVPGASQTLAYGINSAGQIVGNFFDSTGGHGFLYNGSSFTQIDVPGAHTTGVTGINDAGQIVGGFGDHSFLYTGGRFTQIDVPGAINTSASGINNVGQIVGFFFDSTGDHGFLYNGSSFTQIDVPGASYTFAYGINNAGQIVGLFSNSNGPPSANHGFLYNGGSFAQIDVPGAINTSASGINNVGQIVGFFSGDNTGDHSFLYTGGSFTQIDVPGANDTLARGINNAGQIVGSTIVPGGMGDPHFTTYYGVTYDFQGIGDFLLARVDVAGDQFDVQIRLTPWLNGTTIIEGAAATLCGHRVTFDAERARAGAGLVWLDGSPMPIMKALSGGGVALTVGACKISEPSSEEYQLVWDTGETLDVANYWTHLDLSSQLSAIDGPGSVEGLLATELDPNHWRVTGTASLFDCVPEPFSLLGTRARWWSTCVAQVMTNPLMAGPRPWPVAARNLGVSRPGSAARGFALVDHETAALAAQWLISHDAERFSAPARPVFARTSP